MKVIGMIPGENWKYISYWDNYKPPIYKPPEKRKPVFKEFDTYYLWNGVEYVQRQRAEHRAKGDCLFGMIKPAKPIPRYLLDKWFKYFYQSEEPLKKRHNIKNPLSDKSKKLLAISYKERKKIIENTANKKYRNWKSRNPYILILLRRVIADYPQDLASEYWLYLAERAARNNIESLKKITVDFKSLFIRKMIERAEAQERAFDVKSLDVLEEKSYRGQFAETLIDDTDTGFEIDIEGLIADAMESKTVPSSLIKGYSVEFVDEEEIEEISNDGKRDAG